MRDQVVIYDQTYNPAVTGAIAPGTIATLPELDAAEHVFIIEKMYLWPSYNLAGLPADLEQCQILIDGSEFPGSPARLRIRARADVNMVVPYDTRYAVKTVPFGRISLDALEDTTIKVTPAQRISVRLLAGITVGILATDTPIRVMLVGRIAETDSELRDIYGGATYDPYNRSVADPVNGKVTPLIRKTLPITIDNAKYFSGATGQNKPIITPWWSYCRNNAVVNPAPEYQFMYSNLNVLQDWMDMRFDWTRITDRALILRYMGAYITAGRGRLWWDQPSLRRPGHKNLYFGWVFNAGFPNLLPGGGDLGLTPMFLGPFDLKEAGPQILAYNNLTELRATADPGTTVLANNLEVQVRGTHIGW